MVNYQLDKKISSEEFIDLLERSTLAERRPVDDPECIASMIKHADLLVTAWQDDLLIGVARSVTDFLYCCYLSDLAVDQNHQRSGIGRELIRRTRARLGPKCMLILLAAPAAAGYYPHLGFTRHDSAWILFPDDDLL